MTAMYRRLPLVALALAACTDAAAPPDGIGPASPGAARQTSEAAPALVEPTARGSHEPLSVSVEPAAPETEPAPAAPRGPRAERILELEAARAAYVALPPKSRTPHATEVYHLGLLELGQNLISAAGNSKHYAAALRTRAKFVLEELGFDAGEESDFGLRAYQLLADLHRANGEQEDATNYDEAIDRVLRETASESTRR